MSFKIKEANGQIVYIPAIINCDQFCTEMGDDGFIEAIKCVSSKLRHGCKTCGLVNPIKTKRKKKNRNEVPK